MNPGKWLMVSGGTLLAWILLFSQKWYFAQTGFNVLFNLNIFKEQAGAALVLTFIAFVIVAWSFYEAVKGPDEE